MPAHRGRPPKPTPLRAVEAERSARLLTGIGELDRVLGGGLVPGSLVLLGGAPGIGKSTLGVDGAGQRRSRWRQDPLRLRRGVGGADPDQRAQRLGEAALEVPVLAENSLEAVLATIEAERPAVCVIDSVQTLAVGDSAPGSVGGGARGDRRR